VRIAFFGSDGMAACLEPLVAAGHEVGRVYTVGEPDARRRPLLAAARRHDIPVHLGRATSADLAALDREGYDLVVACGYPHLIPVGALSGTRAINVHPALLPGGRGPWPYPHVILRGLAETGVTIHEMDERFDTGPVLCQAAFPVLPTETGGSLAVRCRRLAASLLVELLAAFEPAWEARRPQSGGEYWKRPGPADWTIDWSAPVARVDRQVRAFAPRGARARLGRRAVRVRACVAWPERHAHRPGAVLERGRAGVLVAAGDGFVLVTSFRDLPRKGWRRRLRRWARGAAARLRAASLPLRR
jgi:methionyl-tRNA formyltransferase